MGMILRIASSRIVGQGDIVGRSGYFSLNLSANSVMRGRLDARRTLKSLVADLRNITIPLNKKLYFSVYGSYTLDKKRSVILPATAIPYSVGAGFSYSVGKNMVIGTQTNYQYNIVQKDWEWFCGLRLQINF